MLHLLQLDAELRVTLLQRYIYLVFIVNTLLFFLYVAIFCNNMPSGARIVFGNRL